MLEIELDGRKIAVDDQGYLLRFEDWDEEVARALAKREGIHEIAPDMLDALKFMRSYYNRSKCRLWQFFLAADRRRKAVLT